MYKLFYFVVIIFSLQIEESKQDCKVLQCDDETDRWNSRTETSANGIPGKRGPPGEKGQKGEPGIGVNIEEFKAELKINDKGPKLHHYANTITWNTGRAFCSMLEKRLCYAKELCEYSDGEYKFLYDVIPGDHWVPLLDTDNEWMSIGDSQKRTCFVHSKHYGKPNWGLSTEARPNKGFVYCCEANNESEYKDIKYQYIGKAATYKSSKRHCSSLGRRLCRGNEVCQQNAPIFGVISGDMWVAVLDKANEWIQIGNHLNRICFLHGARLGPQTWGIRTDGSLVNHVGYVLCCNN